MVCNSCNMGLTLYIWIMQAELNPYAPGAGNQPPALTGRDEILVMAKLRMRRLSLRNNTRDVLLLGLRGVGKTVLLNQFENFAEEEGHHVVLVEAPEGQGLPDLLVPQLRRIVTRFSRLEGAKDQARRALRSLGGFAKAFKVSYGDFEIGLDVDLGGADSGNLELDLPELFLSVGRAAQAANASVVILIDEVQYLSKVDFAALIVSLHRVSQKGLPILFFGSGLPQAAGLAGDAKSYAERLFEFIQIGPLNESEANKALEVPAAVHGVSFTPAALKAIYAQTRGYPYFLQEWGQHAWNVATGPLITEEDVEKASVLALNRLDDGFFNVRYDRLTPKEQEYLFAMSKLGPGPHRSGDIAEAFGANVQHVGSARRSLIDKGMIFSPMHGYTAFTVPLFDEFMLRRMNAK